MKPLLLLMLATAIASAADLQWTRLPDLPDKEGFAGMYAGVSNGALLAAGGANFPGKKPWEGGTKMWYDDVYALEQPTGRWIKAGKLPSPSGYGVSITTNDGLLCIGGAEATAHRRECLLLSWKDHQLHTTRLPDLPSPCANMCGARMGSVVYIAGGIETPTSTSTLHTFWSLDLAHADKGWTPLPAWPGRPRMLAVAAICDGSFYLMSGVDLHADADGKPARTYLKDAYRYTLGQGWKQIADLPQPAVAAPSPVTGEHSFLVLGGDDGALVNFEPKDKHPGFPRDAVSYDVAKDAWTKAGVMPVANVTNPAAPWQGGTAVVSGEQRPGVRSPQVWLLKTK